MNATHNVWIQKTNSKMTIRLFTLSVYKYILNGNIKKSSVAAQNDDHVEWWLCH